MRWVVLYLACGVVAAMALHALRIRQGGSELPLFVWAVSSVMVVAVWPVFAVRFAAAFVGAARATMRRP